MGFSMGPRPSWLPQPPAWPWSGSSIRSWWGRWGGPDPRGTVTTRPWLTPSGRWHPGPSSSRSSWWGGQPCARADECSAFPSRLSKGLPPTLSRSGVLPPSNGAQREQCAGHADHQCGRAARKSDCVVLRQPARLRGHQFQAPARHPGAQFGQANLERILAAHCRETPGRISEALLDAVEAWRAGSIRDDICLMVAKIK